MKYLSCLFICGLLLPVYRAAAQKKPTPPAVVAGVAVNYDESKVGSYQLADPLKLIGGGTVTDTVGWLQQRRPEILELFEKYQFGRTPAQRPALQFNIREKQGLALNGKALRRQVTLYFTADQKKDQQLSLLIYLPRRPGPAPLLLQISFVTNAMTVADPAVQPGMAWVNGQRVLQTSSRFSTIDPEQFINAGIGFATVYYGDIEPDFKGGVQYGIRSLYQRPGTPLAGDSWGAIAAWSWGLSLIMDYFEQDADIDAKRVALTGASRLGKTVLWTGARDPRFSIIIPSISGEGGAALSHRNFGETIRMITDTNRYYYQFAPNYHGFSDRIADLPMDSHMLLSLIAPRPLLIQSGDQDYFSDPKGAFLAVKAAQPVYQLFGKKGPVADELPKPGDQTQLQTLGYYLHAGGHTVLPEDYRVFIRFMKRQWGLP